MTDWPTNSLTWKQSAFQNAENWLFALQIYFVFIDLNMEVQRGGREGGRRTGSGEDFLLLRM